MHSDFGKFWQGLGKTLTEVPVQKAKGLSADTLISIVFSILQTVGDTVLAARDILLFAMCELSGLRGGDASLLNRQSIIRNTVEQRYEILSLKGKAKSKWSYLSMNHSSFDIDEQFMIYKNHVNKLYAAGFLISDADGEKFFVTYD